MSTYSGSVNFTKVANAGIKFVYSKATQGTSIVDRTFTEHAAQANATGLANGAYHFFDYRLDGKLQADFFVDTVLASGGFDAKLPPVLDVECFATFGVSDPPFAVSQIRAFVGEVYLRTGRMVAIYTSQHMWRLVAGNDKSFAAYPLWVACWSCSAPLLPIGWKTWVLWQDGPTKLPAISRSFDGDVFNGTDAGVSLLLARTNRISAGLPYAIASTVSLDLGGRDGIAYRVSTDGATWSAWIPRPIAGLASFALGADGPKTVMVQLEDPFGNVSPPSVETLIVDTSWPSLGVPATAFRLGPMTTTEAGTPVVVSWSASDATSGLASAELAGSCGTAPTLTQTLDPTDRSSPPLGLALKPGDRCDVNAQATDKAGHMIIGNAIQFGLALHEQTLTDTTWKGSWTGTTSAAFSGGTARSASKKGAEATFQFTGTDVAFVTTVGPSRGKVQVLVDGAAVGTLSLYAPSGASRQIVFTRHFAAGGTHTLTLLVLGTRTSRSTGTRVDVDAFLVLAP